MATKITSVLESSMRCKFKGYLKLAGQQGTKSDFEAMLTELRAEVRLKAIDTIIAPYPGDQVARNMPLTTAGLKRSTQYILDATLGGPPALHPAGRRSHPRSRSRSDRGIGHLRRLGSGRRSLRQIGASHGRSRESIAQRHVDKAA